MNVSFSDTLTAKPIRPMPYNGKLSKLQQDNYSEELMRLKKSDAFMGVSKPFTIDIDALLKKLKMLGCMKDSLKDYELIANELREVFYIDIPPIDTPISLFYKGYIPKYHRQLIYDTINGIISFKKKYYLDTLHCGYEVGGKFGSDIQPFSFFISMDNKKYPLGSFDIRYWHNLNSVNFKCLGGNVFAIFLEDGKKYYVNTILKNKENVK